MDHALEEILIDIGYRHVETCGAAEPHRGFRIRTRIRESHAIRAWHAHAARNVLYPTCE